MQTKKSKTQAGKGSNKGRDKQSLSLFIAGVMFPNMCKFEYEFPVPDFFKTGGYRLLPENTPSYSPIDLTVFYLETYPKKIETTINLKKWFINHKNRMSEDQVYIALSIDRVIQVKSVSEWKYFTSEHALPLLGERMKKSLIQLLRNNAPFTFKY